MPTDPLTLQDCPLRLVWRSDVHMADVSPGSRTDDWVEAICDKLRQVGKIAWGVKAQAVIDGGDFFHVKSPVRTSHRTIRRSVEIHKEGYPCPVYANFGNHDSVYGDIRWLHQQPLGVLYEAGVFQRLYDEHEALFESGGVTVRVVGVPYHGVQYDRDRLNIKKGDEDYLVVAAHLLATDTTQDSFYDGEDVIRYSDLRDLDADVWCFGHWHQDQGIQEIADGKWVVNIGSLTRGSLSQDNLDRAPACAVLAFGPEGVCIERRDLQVEPASEVFDVQGWAS
jgi:exonuclease SbcD